MTDDYYNAIGNGVQGATLHLTTTDPYDPIDADVSLAVSTSVTGSSMTWTHQFQTASTTGWSVTVSTQTGPFYVGDTTGPVVVNPDTLTGGAHTHQLLIVLPGETYAPGDTAANGRLGAPDFTVATGNNPVQAGASFPVTVIGTDRFYNRVFDTDNPSIVTGANPAFFAGYNPSANFQIASGSGTVLASINRSTNTASFFVNQSAPINTARRTAPPQARCSW